MYQPGETQNQKCINLTERRSTEREASAETIYACRYIDIT